LKTHHLWLWIGTVMLLAMAIAMPLAQTQAPSPPPGGGAVFPGGGRGGRVAPLQDPPANAAPVAPGDISMTPAVKPWTGPRMPDGQPDVQGTWNKSWAGAPGTNWDLEEGPDPRENAGGGGAGTRGEPPRKPVIVRTPDNKIPYQPWARALRNEIKKNFFNPTKPQDIDSNARCLPMGEARLALDQSFELLQTKGELWFLHPYHDQTRVVYLDGRPPLNPKVKLWYGDLIGRWEGNSLVIQSQNNNEGAWYDTYGNFYSNAAKFEERYVFDGDRVYVDVITTDPKVFTRPWTAHSEFVRAQNVNYVERWEYGCFEGERNVFTKLGKDNGTAEKK
jgi:hypothetical protein